MVDIPPALERALAYGDGLFETMLAQQGAIPLLTYHQARLARGLAVLGGSLAQDDLWQSVAQHIQTHTGIVKLSCFRSASVRGYASAAAQWDYHIKLLPPPTYPQRYLSRGVALQPLPLRLAQEPTLAGIKHNNRLQQVQAADLLDKNLAQDGLLCDSAGYVIEGVISNIALVKQGQWITPDLSGSGVDGTMRQYLLDQVASLGLSAVVRPVLAAELTQAEAVFVCNSIFGLWPVRRIGLAEISVNHALTQALWQLLAPLGYLAAYD